MPKGKYAIRTYHDDSYTTQENRLSLSVVTAESLYVKAELAAFSDKLKASLTKQVLDNTAALASTGAYYNQIAPSGYEEYRYIVQQYAHAAMAQIMGGVW